MSPTQNQSSKEIKQRSMRLLNHIENPCHQACSPTPSHCHPPRHNLSWKGRLKWGHCAPIILQIEIKLKVSQPEIQAPTNDSNLCCWTVSFFIAPSLCYFNFFPLKKKNSRNLWQGGVTDCCWQVN